MERNTKTFNQDFREKKIILENARIQLKKEFFGIDSVIDEIIEVVGSWYTLNSIQDKPLIINLWGLTGVGKTSLIARLAKLIEFGEKFYRFDLGEKGRFLSFSSLIDDMCENPQDEPIIIALDEFQHARTIKSETGVKQEIETDLNRRLWDLIDSGKINYFNWRSSTSEIEKSVFKLKELLKFGLFVENGLVINNKELYINEIGEGQLEDEKIPFIPDSFYGFILENGEDDVKFNLTKDLEKYLLTLDGEGSIKFMDKIIRHSRRSKEKYFTKALIVIMGNLDEAYTMSSDFSTDIDADEFHELSKKITIPKIKSQLRARFRNEQIARLGNIHIIYPALNSASYAKIIEQDITSYNQKLMENFNVTIKVQPSVYELLYKEGVYPVQGVRPLFTTNQNLYKSRINYFINDLIESEKEVKTIEFSYENKNLKADFYGEEALLFSKSKTLQLNLEELRKNRNDELQAITAVHESGHVILAGALLNKIPEKVMSVTADDDVNGFVYSKHDEKFLKKADLIPKIAMYLGGIIAEEIVFGKENITSGASSDLFEATSMVSRMIKTKGFGDSLAVFARTIDIQSHEIHAIRKVEIQIQEIIENARKLALKTIQQEKRLLIEMATILTQKTHLNQEEIKALFKQFGTFEIKPIESIYKSKLQNQLDEVRQMENLLRIDAVRMNSEKGE